MSGALPGPTVVAVNDPVRHPMTLIDTPTDDDAVGDVQRLYGVERARLGYVPEFARVFAHAPQVYADWTELAGSIRESMSLLRYELVTLAAAQALHSTYCSLAHGRILRDLLGGPDAVLDVLAGRDRDLDPADVAAMEIATRTVTDPNSITAADLADARAAGLTDGEIVAVVLAASARSFFSTVLGALGAAPDRELVDALEPELQDVLTVGRPTAGATTDVTATRS